MHLTGADALDGLDANGLSDPVADVHLGTPAGPRLHTTRVHRKTRDPVWDAAFDVAVAAVETTTLSIVVRDWERLPGKGPRRLGHVEVPVAEVLRGAGDVGDAVPFRLALLASKGHVYGRLRWVPDAGDGATTAGPREPGPRVARQISVSSFMTASSVAASLAGDVAGGGTLEVTLLRAHLPNEPPQTGTLRLCIRSHLPLRTLTRCA